MRTIKCEKCGNQFVFSLEEQELFRQRSLPDPRFCAICRGIIEAESRDKNRSKYIGNSK